MLKRQLKQTTSFPFFKRTSSDRPQQRQQDIYMLVGLAKNTISGIQVFQHYFCSIYKKDVVKLYKQGKLLVLTKQILSYFFQRFIRIVILRTLISCHSSQTGLCKQIYQDIVGNLFSDKMKDNKKNSKQISKTSYQSFLQKELVEQIFKDYRGFLKAELITSYVQSAKQIQKKINHVLKEVYAELDNPIKFQQLQKREVLPHRLNEIQKKRFIKKNFECICNIQTLRKSYKKQILQHFNNIYKNYVHINFQLLMDTKYDANPNIIKLPKYTLQPSPVIMKLQIYLQLLRKQNAKRALLTQICRNVIKNCLKYHKNTQNFYPKLSLADILIDQKRISSILSYHPLLLSALGLSQNVKNYELRLATELTPNAINYERYYKQFEQQTQLLLNRKYYQPKYIRSDKGQQYNMMAKSNNKADQIAKQKEISQQIHTWRIINLAYFIYHGTFFAIDFNKNKQKNPIYLQVYKKTIKQIVDQLNKGPLTLSSYLPKDQKQLPKQIQGQKKGLFTFQYVVSYFEAQDNDDSLLANLKWQKFRFQLYNRQQLLSNFSKFFSGENAFKKLTSPQKRFCIYYMNQLQKVYQIKLRRQKLLVMYRLDSSESKQLSKQAELVRQLSKQVNKMNLMSQHQKREKNIRNAEDKFNQYQHKNKTLDYVNKDNKMKTIKKINQNIEQLYLYMNCQKAILDNNLDEERILQLLDILKNTKQLANLTNQNKQLCEKFKEKLPFFRKQIQKRINQTIILLQIQLRRIVDQIKNQKNVHSCPQFLKNDKQKWQLICKYFDQKFKLMIDCFLNQKHSYLKQLQQLSIYNIQQMITQKSQKKLKFSNIDIERQIKALLMIRNSWKQLYFQHQQQRELNE